MRPKVPLAYAALLVIALVAVVGFAAFSPSTATDESVETTNAGAEMAASQISARVASAVLAVRVSDAGARTATTQTDAPAATTDTNVAAQETTTTVAHDESEDAPTDTQVETDTVTIDAAAALQSEPADTTPPKFAISSPHDGDTVDSRIVTIKGTVEQGATVRSGPFDAKVNDDGTWSIQLALIPGPNGASLTATDAAGNSTTTRIVVNYKAPTTTTTKATPTTTAPHTDSTPTTTAAHTHSTPTTTAAHTDSTPTTTKPPSSSSSSSKYSSLWPADAGGIRNVEQWRPLVQKYWAADRVDCVLGIIQRESKGDPTAYNSTYGASGLMQHLIKYWPSRAASAGFKDSNGKVASPFNGEANIAAGAAIAGSGSKWYAPWSRLPSYGSCSG